MVSTKDVTECRRCHTPVVYSAFHMQWLGPDGTAWCADGVDHDGAELTAARTR